MKENKHGEKEQTCLDKLKKQIKIIDFNSLALEDINNIKKALASAKPNEANSMFPDFITSNGFIEHFEVTAANMKKNSSEFRQQEAYYNNKTCPEKSEEIKNKLYTEMKPNQIYCEDSTLTYSDNKKERFLESFKRNCEHHLDSLSKYEGKKEIGIFLVEMNCGSMGIFKNGDKSHSYKYHIYQDKELLNLLASYATKIKYIIFYNRDDNIDAIDLSLIPQYLEHIPKNISIVPGTQTDITSHIAISIDLTKINDFFANSMRRNNGHIL